MGSSTAGQEGLLGALLGCCCGAAGMGEELYKDWESHPACQQYTITKRLGEGGFSELHLAHDKLTGKTVALKVVFLNKGGLTKDQRRILAGEARLVRMVAHPHIVRCMQVLETRRQQVLVLEHLSGGEMLRQLQRMKRYSEASACQMFKQVADAVAYLHSLGILHRDIKPENCLLAKPASHYASKNKPVKVKLIDLGMAGLYRPNKPVHGCMGSPGFIAPEVILGEPHTPAMDVYSLGVLLFVMLVGRKPWDAQRSHTLAYAVQRTSEAPGLHDPVFLGLSAPAQQLLAWMLAEEPSRRPTAQQVLGHSWVLQGGVCKVEGASRSAAAGPSRVYQQVVQQRLQVLSHSRDIMGSARGLMVLHGSGSRSQAARFHRAVKAARLQLQTQAAALQASGQVPPAAAAAAGGLQAGATSQTQQAAAVGAGAAGPVLTGSSGASASSVAAASGAAVSSSSGSSVVSAGAAALARSSVPPCAAAADGMRASSGSSVATAADRSRALPRPASTASLAGTAAAEDAAAGEPAASRRQRSVTVGQLARQELNQRHSLLFGALQQQQLQQPQRQPPQQVQQQQQHQGPRRGSMPGGNTDSTVNKGRHRHTASAGGAWFGGSASNAAAAAAAARPGAAPGVAAAAAAQPIRIDVHQLALDELERGMSAPNAELSLFSPPVGGGAGRAPVRQLRPERAVSTSPGVLALLDADDQMCLLHAMGASVEDEEDVSNLLGGGVLSWGRRGAADMVASFRQNYPMRPIARSFARFSQSLSRSLSRSARSPGSLKASASGRYLDAAAAAAATEAHASPQDSVTGPTAMAAAAAAPAAGAAVTSPAAAAAAAGVAAVPAEDEDAGLTRISFFVDPDCSQAAAAAAAAAAVQRGDAAAAGAAAESCSSPAAVPSPAATPAAAAAVAPRVSSDFLLAAGPSRLASTLFSEEGSLDMQHAFLGAQMSLDSSLAASFLAAGALDARSPTASLPHASPLSAAAAAAAASSVPVAAAAAGQLGWMPLLVPAAAASALPLARISVGQHALSVPEDISRVSTGSAGSGSARQSAFASSAGAAAAAAAAADAALQNSDGGPTAAAAAAAQRGSGSDSGPFGAVLQSPSVRAAATAAAARAEEEGIGLPNGLWLQQSASIKSTTVSSILLLLLSPRKSSQAAAAAAAGGGDAGQLGSAGASIELAKAGSSRSLSAGLQPLSPGRQADAGSSATSPAAAVSSPAASAASEGAAAARGPSPPVVHTRDISFIDYLPDVVQPAATEAPGPAAAAAEASAAAVASAMLLKQPGASPAGLSVSSSGPCSTLPAGTQLVTATAAADGRPAGSTDNSKTAAAAAAAAAVRAAGAAAGQSKAVSVPQAMVAAGRGRRLHHSRPAQLWLPSPADGHRRSSSSGGGAAAAAGGAADGGTLPAGMLSSAAEGPAGLGMQCSGTSAGQRTLEHAASAASSVLDREFYVGSFWSPTALGGHLNSRRQMSAGQQQQQQQQQQPHRGLLARSTSSLGRLDSLDLAVSSPAADAELGFGGGSAAGGGAAASPLQAGGVVPGVRVVRRTSSSSAAGGQESKRASVDGGEGLLEGFLPAADCTGDEAWDSKGAGVRQDGAAVLVRVHSGRVFGGAEGVHSSGAAGKAVSAFSSSRQQPYSSGVSTPASTGVGFAAATGPGGAAAAAAAASRVGRYGWIAKAVVSRSSAVQQPQQQPQFDSFDEPSGGEWYFAGQ